MDTRKVKFLSIKHIKGSQFNLALRISGKKMSYPVYIIDRDGIFGIEMPPELSLKLRQYPFSHLEIVNAVKPVYDEMFSNQLQAA